MSFLIQSAILFISRPALAVGYANSVFGKKTSDRHAFYLDSDIFVYNFSIIIT